MAPQSHPADIVSLVVDCHCNLGESPSWDGEAKKLLFVDINARKILIFDPISHDVSKVLLDEMVGAVLPSTASHTLIAALEQSIVQLDYSQPDAPQIKTLASTPNDHGLPSEGWRFNDVKASPSGVLIAGRMHKAWREGKAGRVYALSSNGQLQEIMQQEQVVLPNGMAWDAERRVMYFADTGANAIFSYPTDAAGVPVAEQPRQKAFQLPKDSQHGPPDGITIDSEGNLWVAMAESGHVSCFNSSGEELHSVELPVKRPTALTFGGVDLSTLYITTRVESGDNASPHAGGLYSVQVPGVKGSASAYTFPAQ